MSRVSAIIPSYNRAHLLSRAINSVLSQTSQPDEVLVVDDCSTDGSRAVMEEWVARDARIRPVFLATNQGPGGARNAGIVGATGDLVAFLDSDDEWAPEHLERCAALLEADPALDLVFADLQRITATGRVSDEAFLWRTKRIDRYLRAHWAGSDWYSFAEAEAEVLLRDYCVPVQTTLIRREVAAEFRFDPAIRGPEDYDFFLRLALAGKRFGYVNRVHGTCYIHDQCLYSNRAAPIRECTEEMKIWDKIIHDHTWNSSVRDRARGELSRLLYDLGYGYHCQGMKGDSLRAYSRSLSHRFSFRTIKALLASLITPRVIAKRRFATEIGR